MATRFISTSQAQEDQRLLQQILREQEQDAAINAAPVKLRFGKDHSSFELHGVGYQKCGGGRRVIRKKIGGN